MEHAPQAADGANALEGIGTGRKPANPLSGNLNVLACKICRTQHYKCTRTLPECEQCVNAQRECVYPPPQKRSAPQRFGMQIGYIKRLEERLAETESALYGAITTLRSLNQATAPVTKQFEAQEYPRQRNNLLPIWESLPLRDWEDMERWRMAVSNTYCEPIEGVLAQQSNPIPLVWMPYNQFDIYDFEASEEPSDSSPAPTSHMDQQTPRTHSLDSPPAPFYQMNQQAPRGYPVDDPQAPLYQMDQQAPGGYLVDNLMPNPIYHMDQQSPRAHPTENSLAPRYQMAEKAPVHGDEVMPSGREGTADSVGVSDSNQAEKLSHHNPNLYF